MVSKIKRWGNSLALRIPRGLAEEAGLRESSPVEIKLREGKLVISRPPKPRINLEDLLKLVTKSNLHEEKDTGPAQGGEAW